MRYSMLVFLNLLLLFGCTAENKEPICKKVIHPKIINNDFLIEKDKILIVNCFMNIIKYYNQNSDLYDPLTFFEPYSGFLNNGGIEIEVDTIIYNADAKLCFSFICVKTLKDNLYDALVIVGIRDSVNQHFKIYPINQYRTVRYSDRNKALNNTKFSYSETLKKNRGTSGTQYEKVKFKLGVFDKNFFKDSPYFYLNKNGFYNFQLYIDFEGNLKHYEYPLCN